MKRSMWIPVIVGTIVFCGIFVIWKTHKNNVYSDVAILETNVFANDSVSVSWKGNKITIDDANGLIIKTEEILNQAEDVYKLTITKKEYDQWKKEGFFINVDYANGKEMVIPALQSTQKQTIQSIIIIESENIPGYILVGNEKGKNFVLALPQDAIRQLKQMSGV